jgi:hypothetical protein
VNSLELPHPGALSEPARSRVRKRSKTLFGSIDRLEVAVAIALSDDGVVNATDLHWDLRLAVNRVRAQILALADSGMLTESIAGENGKRMFVRVSGGFWDFCLEWYADSIGASPR